MKLSAVIEDLYMFNEAGDMPARIRAAAAAGLTKVEFHMWNQVDANAVQAALQETGVHLQSLIVGPRVGCVDRSKTAFILEALQRTIAMCQRLGAQDMVIAGGPALKDVSAAEQHAAMVHNLKHLAPVAAVNIALSGTRGHISSPSTPAAPTSPTRSAVCLWQTPRAMEWTNLYAMQQMRVKRVQYGNIDEYMTIIDMNLASGSAQVQIVIPRGADITIHTSAILKRLAECEAGQ